ILHDFLPETAPNRAFTNVLFVGHSQSWDSLSKMYLRKAQVRKIATVGKFHGNAFRGYLGKELEETILAVQDELIAFDKLKDYMEYYYADSLRYWHEFYGEGKSAGLAFAYLALSWNEKFRPYLNPYLACFGSFEDKMIRSVDSESIEAKIQAAKESGIRALILSANQAEVIEPIQWGEIITYDRGHLIDVLESIIPQIHNLEKKIVEQLRHQGIKVYEPPSREAPLPWEGDAPLLFPKATANFVGREAELIELRDKFASHTITIIIDGLAGIGKTELALKFGEELKSHKKFFIECQKDSSVESILNEIARGLDKNKAAIIRNAIKSRPEAPQRIIDALANILDEEGGVLFLDAYEKVKDDELIESLIKGIDSRMERGKIILTTRILPGWETATVISQSKEGLGGLEKEASFELMRKLGLQEDEAVLGRVHEKLKGHPKLIELFSYWQKVGIEAALEELPDAFDESKTYLLKEIVDELSESEKKLLFSVAVYRVNIPLAGIKAVYEEATLGTVLMTLMNRFLISRDEAGNYSIHDIIKEFPLVHIEKKETLGLRLGLSSRRRIETIHQKAADYFLSRSDEITQENYRDSLEAHYHLQQAKRYKDAASLVERAAENMLQWGYWTDLDNMLKESLSSLPDERWKLYRYHGQVFERKGDFTEAERDYQKALSILKKHDEIEGQEKVLLDLGNLYRKRGEYEKALSQYETALKISISVNNHETIAHVHLNKGVIYALQRRCTEALQHCQNALEVYTELKASFFLGLSYNNIGGIYLLQDKYEDALSAFQQSLKYEEWRRSPEEYARTFHNIGYVYLHFGEYDKALDNYQKALTIRKELGDLYEIGQLYCNIGEAFYHQGHHDRANEMYLKALEVARKVGIPFVEAASLNNIGELFFQQGDYEAAGQKYNEALRIAYSLKDERVIAIILHNFGDLYRLQQRYSEAQQMYNKSLELKKPQDYKFGIADTYRSLGLLYAAQGNEQKSHEYLTKARDIFANISAKAKQKQVEAELAKKKAGEPI
ncbi:tetratricopeptide repeat protein, partial [bacterium]|nr:tetratricopeptide repeat protein [bacterium]